jgi:preprotein translocase subunit SecG
MYFGLLAFFFALSAILIILLVLIQKGKGSMGLGNLGGGNQMLFGGSGGQDLFQKATWILGAILIAGSLVLAIWKAKQVGISTKYLQKQEVPAQQMPAPQPADETPEN